VKSFSLSATPDSLQGYGALQLDRFIPLPNDRYPSRDLFVRDTFSISLGTQRLTLRVQSSTVPLKVTIVVCPSFSTLSLPPDCLGRLGMTRPQPWGTLTIFSSATSTCKCNWDKQFGRSLSQITLSMPPLPSSPQVGQWRTDRRLDEPSGAGLPRVPCQRRLLCPYQQPLWLCGQCRSGHYLCRVRTLPLGLILICTSLFCSLSLSLSVSLSLSPPLSLSLSLCPSSPYLCMFREVLSDFVIVEANVPLTAAETDAQELSVAETVEKTQTPAAPLTTSADTLLDSGLFSASFQVDQLLQPMEEICLGRSLPLPPTPISLISVSLLTIWCISQLQNFWEQPPALCLALSRCDLHR
jgi:hypothetical protein